MLSPTLCLPFARFLVKVIILITEEDDNGFDDKIVASYLVYLSLPTEVVTTNMSDIHTGANCPPVIACSDDEVFQSELSSLKAKFVDLFGKCESPVIVRVPGRVNLIGEHIDYCGYGVCPMAIQQDVLLAASFSSKNQFLTIKNTDPMTYPDISIPNSNFCIDFKKDGWISYVLCGIKGALDSNTRAEPLLGMNVLISGTIPPGAGLSSSSALVCAAFLATSHLLKMTISKADMASLCAQCERYIGTAGGGMDQAIAFLATPGCAKHIQFDPLRSVDVPLPDDCVFVVGHSCVMKNKAASADFNIRVAETRIAAQILAKNNYMDWQSCKKLADVQKKLNSSLSLLIKMVEDTFHSEPYTKSEICSMLNVSENELDEHTLTQNTRDVGAFHLRQRALHVFEEAKRVEDWVAGCNEKRPAEYLGKLLTASHKSLKDLYQCSAEKVDELVSTCIAAGALGARLTGAGWGGCVVAMVPKSIINDFLDQVSHKFYGGKQLADRLLFATKPGRGAEVYIFNK